MVDIAVLVREFLLAQPGVTAALQPVAGTPNGNPNDAIYAASDLPEGFSPIAGPGIQIVRSGGVSPYSEIPALIQARVMIRAWADQEQYQLASDVYGAIRDSLNGAYNVALDEGFLLSAIETMQPQETTDPQTAWVCDYAFYQVIARATS